MHPALSVILLTTLLGAGQGLFLALYGAELSAWLGMSVLPDRIAFFATGSALTLALLGGGLVASFFHLGHPERAWRAAAMWRTSWLSREIIALPLFMAGAFAYGAGHYFACGDTLWIGAVGTVLCIALFVCTGMIYACIKFLQEWHTPFTLINYFLLGCASGLTLATAFAAFTAPELVSRLATWAAAATVLAFFTRAATLVRNARIRPQSTLQTAIGVKHPRIAQKAQGFTGASFNTREFFHGRSRAWVRRVKWVFLALAFPLPLLLLLVATLAGSTVLLSVAFAVQYLGLMAERWFFFAEARHPQNLYYQAIS